MKRAMLGGRAAHVALARRACRLQAAMGTVMVVVAVLMAFELDILASRRRLLTIYRRCW